MKHTHLTAKNTGYAVFAGVALALLSACTAPQQSDALVVGIEGVPCALHAVASAHAADTVANTEAVALVLATDPACLALAAPTVDLIKSGLMAGKAVVVAPAGPIVAVKP